MISRELIVSGTEYNLIIKRYEKLQKNYKEVTAIYLARKIEEVDVERIKIKSIKQEKRLNGSVIIDYCVYERGDKIWIQHLNQKFYI